MSKSDMSDENGEDDEQTVRSSCCRSHC